MNFHAWVRRQRARDDSVGDLARLASAEGDFPCAGGYRAWKDHLAAKGYDPRVLGALQRAWTEYGGRETPPALPVGGVP